MREKAVVERRATADAENLKAKAVVEKETVKAVSCLKQLGKPLSFN